MDEESFFSVSTFISSWVKSKKTEMNWARMTQGLESWTNKLTYIFYGQNNKLRHLTTLNDAFYDVDDDDDADVNIYEWHSSKQFYVAACFVSW